MLSWRARTRLRLSPCTKAGAAIPFFWAGGYSTRRCASQGDEGARRLIGALSADELVEVQASDTSAIFDIDTPDDLAAAHRLRSGEP